MTIGKAYTTLTADEAAALIPDGAMVAVGGFTPAGAPKAVPRALARRARQLHEAGAAFQVKLLSGASTGPACDDALGEAEAVSWRAPYQTSEPLRRQANLGQLAHRCGGHVGGPPAHGLGPGQLVVAGRAGRGAAEQLDLEGGAGLV